MTLDPLRRFLARLRQLRLRKPPTRMQWYSDIRRLERLREILTDPTFVSACNFILFAKQLDERVVAHEPSRIALMAAYTAGHADFLKDLEKLAIAPATRFAEPEPFEHIDADYLNQKNV